MGRPEWFSAVLNHKVQRTVSTYIGRSAHAGSIDENGENIMPTPLLPLLESELGEPFERKSQWGMRERGSDGDTEPGGP